MRIEGIRTLAGPNVYTHRPALLLRLDLQDLTARESRELEGFNGRLLEALPGLAGHHCSRGYAGGFAERLREGTYFGHVVEHADDERLARLADEPRVRADLKRVVYFSLRADHVLVRKHLGGGGTAFYVRDGRVVEATGAEHRDVLALSEVPVTMGGTAEFQAANVLACVAACRALGVAREAVAAALATFRAAADNPGRANIFRLRAGGHVVLDYGHNPNAFAAVCRAAARWRKSRVTGIVGVPGDRSDELIEQAARIAARGFGRLVVKEDEDPRGRRRGEVAELMRRAVGDEAPWLDCAVVLCEEDALRRELKRLGPEEIVVMFYDKLGPLRRVLTELGAEPVEAIEGLAPCGEALAAAAGQHAAPHGAASAPLVGVRRAGTAAHRAPAQDWQGHIWR